MTHFESQSVLLHKNQEEIFNLFSDLRNLNQFIPKIAADKIADKLKDFECTVDTFSFSAPTIGKVGFRVNERFPFERIKFVAENMPIDLNLQINLQAHSENETVCIIAAEAELNPFIKGMVSKPIQEAVNKLAETLAGIFR